MTITVTHSTPADGSFSATGATAWNATHSFTGTLDVANGGTGQTTTTAAINALLPTQATNSGKYLTTDGTNTSWATVSGGGSPGGSTTQVQFNNSGAFGGSANFTWDGTNAQLGATGALRFADTDSSNYVAFKAPATVASNVTWTLPATDGTIGQVLSTNGSGILSWVTASTTPTAPTSVEYLVVAGGGGGGSGNYGGAGGAGGYQTSASFSVSAGTGYTVTVGAGGPGGAAVIPGPGTAGSQGNPSVFSTITSTGGGGGGGQSGTSGGNGGSGGGGSASGTKGIGNTPSTSPSQGNDGANGGATQGGGGGGAGFAASGTSGGNGLSSSIATGTGITYAGGGAGLTSDGTNDGTAGTGGGGSNIGGTANTGGGAGAANTASGGYAGGSGVVIIAYPDTFTAPTSISGGLTYTQPTRTGYRVYRFTAGTGTITW